MIFRFLFKRKLNLEWNIFKVCFHGNFIIMQEITLATWNRRFVCSLQNVTLDQTSIRHVWKLPVKLRKEYLQMLSDQRTLVLVSRYSSNQSAISREDIVFEGSGKNETIMKNIAIINPFSILQPIKYKFLVYSRISLPMNTLT